MDDFLDEKHYNKKQFDINSRYKRHTGNSYVNIFQKNLTGQRHWRKRHDINRKQQNVYNRRTVEAEMNEKGKIHNSFDVYGYDPRQKNKYNPDKLIAELYKKVKNKEIHKNHMSITTMEEVKNQKYISKNYKNGEEIDSNLKISDNSFRPYFYDN